ncbi:MAG: S8 family serine peptidase [Armatimonadetes bacterium]|nr:S8 family serine peptidase [Armatimonadota bacterium]
MASVAAATIAQSGGKGTLKTSTDPVLEALAERTLLVGLKKFESAPALRNALPSDAAVVQEIPALKIEVVRLPSKASADALLTNLKKLDIVRYVGKDGVQKAQAFPNDPMYPRQFSHARTGANLGWGLTIGSPNVTVAVVDTGLDLAHEEFAGRIVNPMSFVPGESVDDVFGHGTHCAGIASASGNNGIGVAGVSWNSMIMPVKGLNNSGSGLDSWLLGALAAATDAGANVISYSVGGYRFQANVPQPWIDIVDYMHANNVVFVAASANSGVNLDTLFSDFGAIEVPCSYPPTFAVGASNSKNQLSGFSNYGKTLVEIVAPGESILSTLPGGYGYESGTSMACPYISGTSALLFSLGGTTLSYTQVQDAMTSTAFAAPKGCMHGLVNVFGALRAVPVDTNFDATPTSVNIVYGTLTGGTAADLAVLDDSFFVVQAATIPIYGPTVMYDATYNFGDLSNVHAMLLRQYVKADVPTNSTLNLWDPVKLKWVTFSSNLIGSGVSTMSTFLYAADMAKYIDGNGVMKVRYSGFGRVRRFGDGSTSTQSVSADAQGIKFILK